MLHPGDLVVPRLTAAHRTLLHNGLIHWSTLGNSTDELAVAMGFSGVADLFDEIERLTDALHECEPLPRLDWARMLACTEVAWASHLFGPGSEWDILTGFDDDETLALLRSLQAALLRQLRLRSLVGHGLGTVPDREIAAHLATRPVLAALPGGVEVRQACAEDVPAIVALLADDPLGAGREAGSDLEPYLRAFATIDADPAQLLAVGHAGATVVATLQLTVIPGLSRGGALRGQVEAVRVAADHRGSGLGAALLLWAAAEARDRGCSLLQLTTDKSRDDAHRFYAGLGLVASHEGFKLAL